MIFFLSRVFLDKSFSLGCKFGWTGQNPWHGPSSNFPSSHSSCWWNGQIERESGRRCLSLYQTDRSYRSASCLGPPWCHQIAFDRSVTSLGREGQDTMAVRATTATVAVGWLMGVRVKDKMIGKKKANSEALGDFPIWETNGRDSKINLSKFTTFTLSGFVAFCRNN